MSGFSDTLSIGLLQQLLFVSGRQNRRDAVFEAMPHTAKTIGFPDFEAALRNLGVRTVVVSCREVEITQAECPALMLDREGRCFVLQGVSDGTLLLHSGMSASDPSQSFVDRPATGQQCKLLVVADDSEGLQVDGAETITSAFASLSSMMPWLLSASFISNVLGLMAPLLVMAIYDRVIPSNSTSLLVAMVVGVLLVVGVDFGIRLLRARVLAYVGAQSELVLTTRLFEKLMRLPLSQLTKSDVGTQLSRFRQFEGLRDVFTGHVMMVLLDLPFVLIFFAVLCYLAPSVGWMTFGVAILFGLVSVCSIPRQTKVDKEAAETSHLLRTLLSDAINNQQAVVNLGLSDTWIVRAKSASEQSEQAFSRSSRMRNATQATAQTILGLSTSGAIILGTYAAIDGSMSFGALIAVIALTGKVLSPIHALQGTIPQIISFLQNRSQADRVMTLAEEVQLGVGRSHQKSLKGEIYFSGVTYRPDPLNPPILSQATFKIQPGETVLLSGSDLPGRTAVLDLLDGLYEPLAGTIEHDGIDIRQIAKDELRRSISYSIRDGGLFHGTIDQNFKLAAPDLSSEDVSEILRVFGLEGTVNNLPEGQGTRLNRATLDALTGPEKNLLKVARGAARKATIYAFSEPTLGLEGPQRAAFKAWLKQESGKQTILLASADRSLADYADRFVVINQGRIIVNDTGAEGRKKLKNALNAKQG